MSNTNPELNAKTYTITQLAKEFNITTRTIRFYEDKGLLHPHRDGRKRIYGKRDYIRLKLVLRGKRLGFSLSESRELIDLFDTPRGEEKQLRRFLRVLRERRALLEQQERDIKAVKSEIDIAFNECSRLLAELSDQLESDPESPNPP